jgi:nucleotide-binding universal stress UspA family protein
MNEKRSDARNRYSSSEVVDDASTAVGLADGTPGSILIATNGSPVGDAALHFAIALAKREDVPLRIITVLEPLPVLPSELVASGQASHDRRARQG